MDEIFLKNLYKQRLSLSNYVDILKESLLKIVSLDLLNSCIEIAIIDNNHDNIEEVLNIFLLNLKTNINFYNVFTKSCFILFLERLPLSYNCYLKIKEILLFLQKNGSALPDYAYNFSSMNFFNYALYKKFYNDYTFDLEVKSSDLSSLQVIIYKEILKNICIHNRNNTALITYLKSLDVEKDYLLAMVDPNFSIDITSINDNNVFMLYPSQINKLSSSLLCQFYLCNKNANKGKCIKCSRAVLPYEYNEMEMENLVSKELENFRKGKRLESLGYYLIHCEHGKTCDMLRLVLKYLHKNYDYIWEALGVFDYNIDGNEEVLLSFYKQLSSDINVETLKMAIKCYKHITPTSKLTFAFFVILYEGFLKHSHKNKFLHDFLLGVVYKHKEDFNKIKKFTFEYYILNIEDIKDNFYENFEQLKIFFCENDLIAFIDTNMFYIYPIIYPIKGFSRFIEKEEFNAKFFHCMLASLILKNEIDTLRELGYERLDNVSVGMKVIPILLLEGYYQIELLDVLYGNFKFFLKKNITNILFELKRLYLEKVCDITVCIFNVLRSIFNTLREYFDLLGNSMFPFVEFFLSKKCYTCKDSCKDIFVDFVISLFNKTIHLYQSRIYPFLKPENMISIEGENSIFAYLNCITILLSAKGHFSRDLIFEKVLYLFKQMFVVFPYKNSFRANRIGDEYIIYSFLLYFKNDYSFNEKFSSIYYILDNLNIKEIKQLIGYISDNLLHKGKNHESLKRNKQIDLKLETIAKVMLEKYLFNIDIKDHDLHYFVIQETLKYVKGDIKLNDETERLTLHFHETLYSFDYDPVEKNTFSYDNSYNYEKFLRSMFSYLLFQCKRDGNNEFYNLLKYGDLFDTKILEFSVNHLLNKVLENNDRYILNSLGEILDNISQGVNDQILQFIVCFDINTKGLYFDRFKILAASLHLREFFYCIQLLEYIIRSTSNRSLCNLLQYCYFKIKDYENTRAIVPAFDGINSINLFFEFFLDKNYEAAKDCLKYNSSKEQCDVLKFLEKNNIFFEDLIEDIIKQQEEQDLDGFLEQCKLIEEDFKEWKNISPSNNISLHFRKDCELIESSENILQTLELISERRSLSENDVVLIKCHEILLSAIRKFKFIGNSKEYKLEELIEESTNNSFLNQENSTNVVSSIFSLDSNLKPTKFKTSTESYTSLKDFELDIKYSHIRKLIEFEDFTKACKEIGIRLANNEWSILYEFSELYLKQNKINKSKDCLRKLLRISPRESLLYKKSLIKYAQEVNSKSVYEEALKEVKDSAYLYLLYAKKLESHCQLKSIEYYVNSLSVSGAFKYEAVPRLFHLISEIKDKKKIKSASRLIESLLENNMSIFLPFFSQISPKLSHRTLDVSDMISKVLLKIMDSYPKCTHWKSLLLLNSSDNVIKERTKKIISGLNFDNKIFLNNIRKMSEILSELSKSNKTVILLKEDFPEIYDLISLNINVPNTEAYISDIENEVKIYSSLQAPKRVCFIGNDGKKYYWLCKYKDDLRKDSRFMELNVLCNKIFKKENIQCYIRTYSVIPFAHNYGIIEMIEGLHSLKSICNDLYQRDNISINQVARKFSARKKIGPSKFREVVSMFSPKFHLWFKENFITPFNWYQSRTNYIKTYAVMNIVGWFMGLGDRHADNILFDINTGDTVHVDLNCIFGKAKTLSIPETVPFRLTQNIVDAFGILKLEGTYKKTMHQTLKILVNNKDILVSNLLSFVYDPLHEWGAHKDKTPKRIIDDLYTSLTGIDLSSKIESLNEDSMSDSNLCNIYIGWLPFI